MDTLFKKGCTPWNKGSKAPPKTTKWYESMEKRRGVPRVFSPQWRENISKAQKVRFLEKENHPRWIADRGGLKRKQERNDSAYHEWRRSVRDRDGWLCKVANSDCLGKVVAHHILPWAKFPGLRYVVENGITLCSFHHPRKREEEARLSPYFQGLITNNKSLF